MRCFIAVTASLLLATSCAWAQSVSTGRGDDNYGSNVGAGNNASDASTNQSAEAAGQKVSKSAVNRRAANQPAPGKSAAETAGAATPNDSSRPEAAAKSGR
jgi:hypothetical protein